MNRFVISVTRSVAVALAAASLVACEASKSSTPTSPNVAGPIAGVNISTPSPVSPANGMEVLNTDPLRLVFGNANSNSQRPFWYVVELAADAGFNSKLYTNPKVTPATGGQTTLVVDVRLGADATYYWRVKAEDGANASEFSPAAHFDLVVPVVIEAPSPVSPAHGETTANTSPNLVLANGRTEGRAGSVVYRFEIARDQAFTTIAARADVPRSGGSHTTYPATDLPHSTLFYWRALGTNGIVSSAWSSVQSFRTPVPPPAPPPGGGGGGGGGTPEYWTQEQWRVFFFQLVAQKGGPTVTFDALARMRADINAKGADWQNGWRGDYRPRLQVPVPGCPPPTAGANAPPCTWDRAIDLGDWGGPWKWVPRY